MENLSSESKPARVYVDGEDSDEQRELKWKIEQLENTVKKLSEPKRSNQDRKSISEYKVIQNVASRTDYKLKIREWNTKFVSAMGQVNPAYAKAIKKLMH